MKNKQATMIAFALLACVGVMCIAYFIKTRSGSDVVITPKGDTKEVVDRFDDVDERDSGSYSGWSGTRTDPGVNSPEQGDEVVVEPIATPVSDASDSVGQDEPTSPTLVSELDEATTETLTNLEPGMVGVNEQGQKVLIGPNGEEILLDKDGNPIEGEMMKDGTELTGVDDDDIPKIDAGVYGMVVRGEQAVKDARLRLEGVNNGYRLDKSTEGDGLFRFPVPGVGDYMLYLHSPSGPNTMRTIKIVEEGDWIEEEFVVPDLEPATGLVVDNATREGIDDAEINVSKQGIFMGGARTSRGGEFTLIPLDQGTYTAEVKAMGYPKKEFSFTIYESGPADELYFPLVSSPVRGYLYYPDGRPVSNGVVSLFGTAGLWSDPYADSGWVPTSMDGSFTLAIPDVETTLDFKVGGYKEGYLPAYSQVIERDGEIPPVVDVYLKDGFEITAKVIDESDSEISGALVEISEGFFETGNIYRRFNKQYPSGTSNDSGRVAITPVEEGDIKVKVSCEGYTASEYDFSVSGDMDLGDLVLEGGPAEGRISGFIVDENYEPIVGMNVDAENLTGNGAGSDTSDGKGAFVINDLPEGDYLLTCAGATLRGNLFIPLAYEFPFAKPGDSEIYLVFDLSHSLEVIVVDTENQPVTEFSVGILVEDYGSSGPGGKKEMIRANYNRQIQTTDGIVVLDNLITGSGTLSITDARGNLTKDVAIEVSSDGSGDAVKVVLDVGAKVVGQVTSSFSSNGLSGVKVKAVPPIGSSLNHPLNINPKETFSDDSGFFLLSGLPEGNVDFILRKQGYKEVRLRNRSLSLGEQTDLGEIEMLEGAILSGVAYKPDGSPINNIVLFIDNQTTYTDSQGSFRLDTLSEGSYQLTATDQLHRYDSVSIVVELEAGEETEIEINFEESPEPTATPEPTPEPVENG